MDRKQFYSLKNRHFEGSTARIHTRNQSIGKSAGMTETVPAKALDLRTLPRSREDLLSYFSRNRSSSRTLAPSSVFNSTAFARSWVKKNSNPSIAVNTERVRRLAQKSRDILPLLNAIEVYARRMFKCAFDQLRQTVEEASLSQFNLDSVHLFNQDSNLSSPNLSFTKANQASSSSWMLMTESPKNTSSDSQHRNGQLTQARPDSFKQKLNQLAKELFDRRLSSRRENKSQTTTHNFKFLKVRSNPYAVLEPGLKFFELVVFRAKARTFFFLVKTGSFGYKLERVLTRTALRKGLASMRVALQKHLLQRRILQILFKQCFDQWKKLSRKRAQHLIQILAGKTEKVLQQSFMVLKHAWYRHLVLKLKLSQMGDTIKASTSYTSAFYHSFQVLVQHAKFQRAVEALTHAVQKRLFSQFFTLAAIQKSVPACSGHRVALLVIKKVLEAKCIQNSHLFWGNLKICTVRSKFCGLVQSTLNHESTQRKQLLKLVSLKHLKNCVRTQAAFSQWRFTRAKPHADKLQRLVTLVTRNLQEVLETSFYWWCEASYATVSVSAHLPHN